MEGEQSSTPMGSNDHDLLITLAVRFADFEKNQRSAQDGITDKLLSLLAKVDKTVNKEDLAELERQMNTRFTKVDERVRALEERNHAKDVEKETVIKLGAGGVKMWHLFIGAFFFIVSVTTVIANLIHAIKD